MDYKLDFAGGVAVETLVAVLALLVGTVLVLFGSRYFKITLFSTSFIFGASLTFFTAMAAMQLESSYSLAIAFVAGVILGIIATKLWKFSLFILGAGVGLTIYLFFKAFAPSVLAEEWMYYIVMVLCCFVFGGIAIKMEKFALIVFTPMIGSLMIVQGVNHFIEENLSVFRVLEFSDSATMPNPCSLAACQVLYGCLFGISIFGMVIQYRFTSEYAVQMREDRMYEKEMKEEKRGKRDRQRERRDRHSRRRHRRRTTAGERRNRYKRRSTEDYDDRDSY